MAAVKAPLDLDAITARILRVQTERKLDQGYVADCMGISRTQWNRIVNGKASIGFVPLGRMVELAAALGVDLAEILS